MKSVRLINQSERKYTKQVSPHVAFANLFATAKVTSQVKTA